VTQPFLPWRVTKPFTMDELGRKLAELIKS